MNIIFHGKHNQDTAINSFMEILRLLNDKYQIQKFREISLSLTLVDKSGFDVELVDDETNHAYRTMEIFQQGQEYLRTLGHPALALVVDNTGRKDFSDR